MTFEAARRIAELEAEIERLRAFSIKMTEQINELRQERERLHECCAKVAWEKPTLAQIEAACKAYQQSKCRSHVGCMIAAITAAAEVGRTGQEASDRATSALDELVAPQDGTNRLCHESHNHVEERHHRTLRTGYQKPPDND